MWSRNCLPFHSILIHPSYCHWVRIARILVFCVVLCRSHFLSLFIWPLYCLFFFGVLVAPLESFLLCSVLFFSFVLVLFFAFFFLLFFVLLFFSALFWFCSVCVLYRMPLDCLFLTAISVFSDVYIQRCSSSHMSS